MDDDDPVPKDPFCDPDNPKTITFEDVSAAQLKIKDGIVITPCIKSHLSEETGIDIYLKKDFLQYTGSFKERGARCAMLMLSDEARKRGVIAASLGNHAQAISYHGNKLGIPATVVMPVVAPIMKVQKCRAYKANVIVQGKDMAEAKAISLKLAAKTGATYINGYDHPHVIAGQGTMGLEILDQVEDIDAVIIPTGGGSLISGIALTIKKLQPKVLIYGVESESCPGFSEAMKVGKPILVPLQSTLADGLAVPLVGVNSFKTAQPYIDKMVTVSEEYIALAILRLIELEKCVVEGAGACGLAAIIAGKVPELVGKRVVLILSGGNIDTTLLGRCLERGLAAEGRMLKMKVTVSDRPGGISELCEIISSIGVTIKDILHERAWIATDVFSVEAKVVCETRDYEHSLELQELVRTRYKDKAKFVDFPETNIKQRGITLRRNSLQLESKSECSCGGNMNDK